MTTGTDWQAQVGRNWADMYSYTDRSFAGLTRHLLERIEALPGASVLDVGCGAGELALAVAQARPQARVVGVDVSADLIEAARLRGAGQDNAEFVLADAATWVRADFAPDLLISRHGVMFFEDPPRAFAHLRTMAAPGANLVFSCFRTPGENVWASGMSGILGLPPPADPYAAGPFAFADPKHVEDILSAAGWAGIAFKAVDYPFLAGQGEDPVADARAMFARIGPAAAALRGLDDKARASAEARITPWLGANRQGDTVVLPAAAWIVTAQNG
jgi:SAM-dependent methyltransferase